MSEKKRFVQSKYAHHLQDIKTDTHYYLTSEKIGCKDLFDEIERLTEENEQLRKYNEQLKKRLEKINGGYGHLTHRNGLTANEWLIESQERELQKKNEQISDWIEQHSKDVVKIGEQQVTINQLNLAIDDLLSHTGYDEIKKENEMLKKQLNEMIVLFSESGLDYFTSDELEDCL